MNTRFIYFLILLIVWEELKYYYLLDHSPCHVYINMIVNKASKRVYMLY